MGNRKDVLECKNTTKVKQNKSPFELMEELGLIGCIDAKEKDLSISYKKSYPL